MKIFAVLGLLIIVSSGGQASAEEKALIGDWMFTVSTDPMDDSTVAAATRLENGALQGGRDPVSLTLRCKDGILDFYIAWNDYLGNVSFVEMRIGKGRSERKRWNMSNNDTASFYPASVPFLLEQLAGEETLAVRTTPYRSSPITAVFDLSRLQEVTSAIELYCAIDSSQAYRSGRGSVEGQDVHPALKGLTLFSDGKRVTVEAISGPTSGPFQRGDVLDTIDGEVINNLTDLADISDSAEFRKIVVERGNGRKRIRVRQ